MTHTVLRCTTAADLIAVIPRLTGFTDHHSVFLMLFQGKRGNRVLRFSLPNDHTDIASESLAEGIVTLLRECGAGSQAPAVVIRTKRRFSDDGAHPWQHFAAQLQLRIRREGWRLREFALVAADGWCEFFGDAAGVKRSLSELDESEYAQQLDSEPHAQGALFLASERASSLTLEALGAARQPTPARASSIARHLRTLCATPEAAHRDESSELQRIRRIARAADSCFRAVSGAVDEALGDTASEGARDSDNEGSRHSNIETVASSDSEATPSSDGGTVGGTVSEATNNTPASAELARLIHAAQRGGSWLVVALTALTRAEFVASVTAEIGASRLIDLALLDDQHADPGILVDWTAEALLRSLANELPERRRLLCAVEVFRDAAAHAPKSYRPAVLALLAWAWWLLGLQSVAAQVLRQVATSHADGDHPDHQPSDHAELVELVTRLIAAPAAAHLNQLKQQFGDKRKVA